MRIKIRFWAVPMVVVGIAVAGCGAVLADTATALPAKVSPPPVTKLRSSRDLNFARSEPQTSAEAALIARGRYLARAADCASCHTANGGIPYAGGLEIATPFGSLSTPNITPDHATGIGNWTSQEFYRAVADGIGPHGKYLYPVMPFPSYTRMTKADILAIKAYLFSLKPVYAPRKPSHMLFPFNIRESLIVWRMLFFRPGVYQPNPHRSEAWNRGAYLVMGPGHCDACHAPRNIMGATIQSKSLSGGLVRDWVAPDISAAALKAKHLSTGQIAQFLSTGHARGMGVAFGPMAEVVHNSLRYLTPSDIDDIAIYLRGSPDHPIPPAQSIASVADLQAGKTLYVDNCSQCHRDTGMGVPGHIADLADNYPVHAAQPNDVILAVLRGLQGTGTYGHMPSFAGAFSNQEVADVANYVRTAWGRHAPANATAALVGQIRNESRLGLGGSEAARTFDCPRVGVAPVPHVLATPQDVAVLATANGADIANRVTSLLAELQIEQPEASQAQLTNEMIASYCPVVANLPDLTLRRKRERMQEFTAALSEQMAATTPPPDAEIMATVPLSTKAMARIDEEAAEKGETPQAYMANMLAGKTARPK